MPLVQNVALIENRPNFQSLSEVTRVEELRRINGSISAMASFSVSTKPNEQEIK